MPRVKRSRTINPSKRSPPTRANDLQYLTGYQDTASGGLSFGKDHQIVKNPENVYTVDRAFRDARTPKKDPVCEVRGCSADATYGANNSIANAKRCPAHRGETDIPVMCAVSGCTEKVRLVRAGTDEPVCLWHADPEETAYVTVRGTMTCVCGKWANFGMGKSLIVCGQCAEVLNRVLKTPLVHVQSGNCGICAKVQGSDILIRKNDGEKLNVCRKCYDVAKPGEYMRGQRYRACHECGKSAILKCDEDGHFACSSHKRPGKTYSHHSQPCREPGCEKRAYYATDFGARPVACGAHKTEIEHNVDNKRCRICLAAALRWYDASQLSTSRKKLGKCKYCDEDGQGPKRQFYEQTICAAIALALDEAGVEYTVVFDKILKMHATTDRRRPDAVFLFGKKRTVFIEATR